MKFSRSLLPLAAAIIFSAPNLSFSQERAQPVVPSSNLVAPATDSPIEAGTGPQTAGTQNAHKPEALLGRWLDLKSLSFGSRYRNAYDNTGFHLFESGQERSFVEGRLKLDAQARYAIGFRASSGRYFNWSYANFTGEGLYARYATPAHTYAQPLPVLIEIGTAAYADPAGLAVADALQSNGWQFYMRDLYFSATPIKAVTIEFGSFGFERGFSTEITTFDEDGYLSGERIKLHDPSHLFFDQVSFTNAFFGDIATPNLFQRGSSLENFNYRQLLASKQLNQRIAFSGEYTWQLGTDTTREAFVLGTSELKAIDKVRFEGYQRLNAVNLQGLNVKSGSGFAAVVDKKLGKHLAADFGFASIEDGYSAYSGSRLLHATGFSLNGDTYGQGKRYFTHASYKINPVVTAFGFYTHAVGAKGVDLNQQGLNAGLNFDLKALVNSEKRIF